MKKLIVLFFPVFLIFTCDFGSTTDAGDNTGNAVTDNPSPIDETVKATPPPETANNRYLIGPGLQVGRIKKDFNEKNIIDAYDIDQIEQRDIGVGEGETENATVVLPGTPNELIVFWKDGEQRQQIDRIQIGQGGTDWRTATGITTGTTLADLERINGKPFGFYGFEWDYAGTSAGWKGGQISEKLRVVLVPENPEAVFPDLLGDQEFSSDHPKAKAAGLKVESMTVLF